MSNPQLTPEFISRISSKIWFWSTSTNRCTSSCWMIVYKYCSVLFHFSSNKEQKDVNTEVARTCQLAFKSECLYGKEERYVWDIFWHNRQALRGCFLWNSMQYNKTNAMSDFYWLSKLMKTTRNVKLEHSENNRNHTASIGREHNFRWTKHRGSVKNPLEREINLHDENVN